MVSASDEELSKGFDPLRTIDEDDPNLAKYIEEGRCEPWIIEEGTFQEGMIQATRVFLAV